MSPITDKTPRRTTRRSTATPVRDVSPPAHNTRAASTALQSTPATRRSTRAASRKPEQSQDVANNNNALPEVQTRQSYAYGSSKTPLLPEQLNRDALTMKQVAVQMNTAIDQAEQTLDTRATDLEDVRKQSQNHGGRNSVQRQTSKELSPPASVTTDAQKKRRTAAWASSLGNGQLDDIQEEDQPQIDSPETRRTEPSSFPSGVFDQSYQYERGLRPPRRPPRSGGQSFGSKLGAGLDHLISSASQLRQFCLNIAQLVGVWMRRMLNNISRTVSELPDSRIVSILTKSFLIIALAGFLNYMLCLGYTRVLCSPVSASYLSRTLESWCGMCQTSSSTMNFTLSPDTDVHALTSALKHIDTQIRSIESRLNSRLDSKVSALHTDIDSLRKEQSDLIHQIEDVSNRASQQSSSADIASPLIPKINYFAPANGAIVNVHITSPTRQAPMALPFRIMTRLLGIEKYKAHNPVTALEPWHDVGDCWCAAATAPGQDSIRLGVGVREYIYPTELIIEHPPKGVSLTPETAPRQVELWADFQHLDQTQWQNLGIDTMVKSNNGRESPFGKTFGLIAEVEYDLTAHASHLQLFKLNVNQHNDLRYSALDFAIRVRSTYGGEFGCLYRVRLHGVPVVQHKDDAGSFVEGEQSKPDASTSYDDDEVLR